MVIWAVYNPAAALSAEDDQSFLKMINQIREAPYDYARDLGYTHEELIKKEIGPETAFASYTLDEGLTVMAETESHSASEEPPVYRLTASTGGVVSFFNFMTRETACKIVIDYLFKEELNTNTFSHILSEEYSYAGIAISAGKVGSGNAWFVAIRLRSAERVSEIQMLNLINEVRSNPKNIWEYTKLTQAEAYKKNSDIPDLIYSEYKPLFFDASLSASARAHSDYELNGTYPDDLLETQTALERAASYGYEGDVVQEALNAYSVPEKNGLPVDSLFRWLIRKELEEWPQNTVAFLNDFQDVGSSIAFLPDDEVDLSVLSFVVGKNEPNTSNDEGCSSNNDQMSRIYGVLFSDNDGDGFYDPEEELIQQDVTVSVHVDGVDEMQKLKTVRTDNAGHFSMTLETNRQYNFVAAIDENVQVAWDGNDGNLFITSDQFVKLVYTPTPPENNISAVDIQ